MNFQTVTAVVFIFGLSLVVLVFSSIPDQMQRKIIVAEDGKAMGADADVVGTLRELAVVSQRHKRSTYLVTECIKVTSEEGRFFIKSLSNNAAHVCGLYLMANYDEVIEVKFGYINVPCKSGIVSFVDGWELNGGYFPPDIKNENGNIRFYEFCGAHKRNTLFISSQNAALIQYRLPKRGQGFIITVKHRVIPRPCNVLIEGSTSYYSLSNFGRNINCSIMAMYPAIVKILTLQVGQPLAAVSSVSENCESRQGLLDYVEIGGSMDFDTTELQASTSLCGSKISNTAGIGTVVVLCPMSIVRLISSGIFDNAITVFIDHAVQNEDDDLLEDSTLICHP